MRWRFANGGPCMSTNGLGQRGYSCPARWRRSPRPQRNVDQDWCTLYAYDRDAIDGAARARCQARAWARRLPSDARQRESPAYPNRFCSTAPEGASCGGLGHDNAKASVCAGGSWRPPPPACPISPPRAALRPDPPTHHRHGDRGARSPPWAGWSLRHRTVSRSASASLTGARPIPPRSR
jgi:hypothetical protein